MSVFPLRLRAHRAVFWTLSFLAVNFLLAFAGCGPKETPPPVPAQSSQGNPEYQRMKAEAAMRNGRPGAQPSSAPSGSPTGAR